MIEIRKGHAPADMKRARFSEWSQASPSAELAFLAGEGEMAEYTRRHDWAATPLGAPEHWSPSLKAMVRMALTTRHPIFIFWGPELICLYNDAYSASLGPEKHPAILGAKGRDAWPEIWPIIGPQIEMVMRGEGATWHENQLVPILRHGAIQDVYWTYSFGPIDEAGAPNGIGGVLVVCTETTAQVLTERRTAAERENFAQLFEQAPGFMALLRGPRHVFEMVNPSYMRLIGNREVLGRSVAEALPDAVAQGYVQLLDNVYSSGKAFTAHGSRFVMQEAGGNAQLERYFDFVYQPIVDTAGTVVGIFVEGVDVCDRQKADEELRRLATRLQQEDQRKTEFLATLAHELRNPLAPLRNGLEALRLGQDERAAAETGDMMRRQLDHMVHLVDDLMDASRISSGKILLELEHTDLRKVLETAVETSRPLVDAKRHQLTLAVCNDALPVDADRIRMSQAVSNLLNNAAKYTPAGGSIELSARREGNEAVVSVSDDGVGIAADLLEFIFDMFAQVTASKHASDSGLGIGLTLVRRLADLHGGSVCAARRPDRGMVFTLRIPLADAVAHTAPAETASARPPSANLPLRVLVVDDNVDSASSMRELVELMGHDAREAHDGVQALEMALAFKPEIVFLDLGMPGKDGYAVAHELRAAPETHAAIIVALTGWGSAEDLAKTRVAGFDLHLTKPADFKAIEGILSRHSSTTPGH